MARRVEGVSWGWGLAGWGGRCGREAGGAGITVSDQSVINTSLPTLFLTRSDQHLNRISYNINVTTLRALRARRKFFPPS